MTRLVLAAAVLAAGVLSPGSPGGHATHHPPGAPPTTGSTPSTPPAMGSTDSNAGGGMEGGMAEMMAGMMPSARSGGCVGGDCGPGARATPLYPSLMTLPSLTPEQRAEIDALANQQIGEGMARLAEASESLHAATQAGDDAAMQRSVRLMREALAELEAGVAARRVLSEGKAPRNLALAWFKREMNLASPSSREPPRSWLGVTPFHLFTMVLLIAFALAMVAMYFVKMRRAAALFGRLEAGAGSPPPGSAPPLAGTPAPGGDGGFLPPAPPTEKPPAPPTSPQTPATSAATGGPSTVPASAPAITANWRGHLRVGSIVTETPSVKTFRLLPPSGGGLMPFTFVPGQFLNVAFSIGGARMNRSYSISSSPMRREHVDLTVRREPRGAVSRHIVDLLEVGDAIEAGGPVGRFTFDGTEADSIVLISGGVGITPMMSITRYLTERSWPGDIFFVYACRGPTDFIFADDIATLERDNPKLHVVVTMSRAEGTDWQGPRGRLTKELLTQTVPDLAARRVHLCGPPSMMDSTKAILTELGVAPERVKTELFGAIKPSPAAAGTSAKSTPPATGPLVTFSNSDKAAKIHVDQTVLELSEELGIGIEYSCRVGTCGVCKVKLTAGEVEMAVEDALDPDDRAIGIILACQAKPKGAISVEA